MFFDLFISHWKAKKVLIRDITKLIRNGSLLKNADISGALYTLRIQYEYTQIQFVDGARYVRVL